MPVRRRQRIAGLLLAASQALSASSAAGSGTNASSIVIRLPLEIRRGAAFVTARVNEHANLRFKLDTGFGVTTIHPALVEPLGLRPAGSLTIHGIAGRERANCYAGATFHFDGATYAPRRVAVISSDGERPRRARDGILGAGFFRRFVVELDPQEQRLTLREPAQFQYTGEGETVPLRFPDDTPVVEAALQFAHQPPVLARYEIDTGCDSALCLGQPFVQSNRLDHLAVPDRNGTRVGVGGSVDTFEGRLPEFRLGPLTFTNVTANFFAKGSPAGDGLAGHIGLGLLRQFKIILDYERRRMILEPHK